MIKMAYSEFAEFINAEKSEAAGIAEAFYILELKISETSVFSAPSAFKISVNSLKLILRGGDNGRSECTRNHRCKL